MSKSDEAKQSLRLLRFLEKNGNCSVLAVHDAKENSMLFQSRAGASMMCGHKVVQPLIAAAVVQKTATECALTEVGRARLKRISQDKTSRQNDISGFRAQHMELNQSEVMIGGASHTVLINDAESPLTRLRRMKAPSGGTWLDDAAFAAGERLRSDFTHGKMMQRTTSSWNFGPSMSDRGGPSGSNITDQAMDARARLERALEVVGPELAGVVMDVCCFLKGLENVERERRWPPRSAKLMLRTGLNLLARHYGTRAGSGRNSSKQDLNQSKTLQATA